MTFHIPSLVETLAIVVVFFVAGFSWSAGRIVAEKVFARLFR